MRGTIPTRHTMQHVMLFFGVFDPIHNGHIQVALAAYQQIKPENITFVLTPQSPSKVHQSTYFTPQQRLTLLQEALRAYPHFTPCDIEMSRPAPQYTSDSLQVLRQQHPNTHFSMLFGEDQYHHLPHWKNYSEIIDHHPLYLYRRTSDPPTTDLPPATDIIIGPPLPISSTQVRDHLRRQKPITDMVPNAIQPTLTTWASQ